MFFFLWLYIKIEALSSDHHDPIISTQFGSKSVEKWAKLAPKSEKNCVPEIKMRISPSFNWQFQIWQHLHNFQNGAHISYFLVNVHIWSSEFPIWSNFLISHAIFVPSMPNRLNATKYPLVRTQVQWPGVGWMDSESGWLDGLMGLAKFGCWVKLPSQVTSVQVMCQVSISGHTWVMRGYPIRQVLLSKWLALLSAPTCSWEHMVGSWRPRIGGSVSARSFASERSRVLWNLGGFCWVRLKVSPHWHA